MKRTVWVLGLLFLVAAIGNAPAEAASFQIDLVSVDDYFVTGSGAWSAIVKALSSSPWPPAPGGLKLYSTRDPSVEIDCGPASSIIVVDRLLPTGEHARMWLCPLVPHPQLRSVVWAPGRAVVVRLTDSTGAGVGLTTPPCIRTRHGSHCSSNFYWPCAPAQCGQTSWGGDFHEVRTHEQLYVPDAPANLTTRAGGIGKFFPWMPAYRTNGGGMFVRPALAGEPSPPSAVPFR